MRMSIRGVFVVTVLLAACGSPGPAEAPLPADAPIEEAEAPPVGVDPPEEAPPEPTPPPPDDGDWVVSESTNPLDDSTTVIAMLDAAEGLGGVLQERIRLEPISKLNT